MQIRNGAACAVCVLVAALMGYVAGDPRREHPTPSGGQWMQAVALSPVSPEAFLKMRWDEAVSPGESPSGNRTAEEPAPSLDSPGSKNAAVEGGKIYPPDAPFDGATAPGVPREQWIRFLRQSGLPEQSRQAQWIELKNEAWNLLRNDPGAHELFEGIVLGVLADGAQPEVFRNYALQHLGAWLLDGHGGREALGRIWMAAREVESSIGGTALIALAALCSQRGRVDAVELAPALETVIRSPSSSEVSLIAAIQVCGEMGLRGAAAPLLELAEDTARSTPVRMAAVAALGMGPHSRAAQSLLRRLEAGPDPRLQRVAANELLRWQN